MGQTKCAGASAEMSAPSRRRGIVGSSWGYFTTQAVIMLAGFVSMPVLTRLLSKEEYGLLNLVWASVNILALIGRLGFPQAMTRFFVERQQQGARHLSDFCGAMLGGAFAVSALVGIITALSVGWIAGRAQPQYARCLQLACLVVVTRVVLSVIYQTYRAQERVFAFNLVQVFSRFGTLALAMAFLFLVRATAYEVILATLIGESVVLVASLADLIGRGIVAWPTRAASWPAIALATAYGLPLVLATSSSFILEYGDRFMIQRFLGLDAVANYAVPYDLVQNVAAAVFSSVNLAVVPIVLRVWTEEGSEAATRLLSQLATYLLALAIPLAALLLMLNENLILLLASGKYSGSAGLTPYLLPGVFMGELNFLFAVPLMIEKDTRALAVITLLAGALNLLLNLVLLPRWGLPGAGVATTVSYAALTGATWLWSRPVSPLRLRLRYAVIAKSAIATGIMVAALASRGPVSSHLAMDLAVRGAFGVMIVAVCMWIFDADTRSLIWLRIR
jgi:O-antigen/teichoic acid export membrane protein